MQKGMSLDNSATPMGLEVWRSGYPGSLPTSALLRWSASWAVLRNPFGISEGAAVDGARAGSGADS